VAGDLLGDVIERLEGRVAVMLIGLDHGDDLGGVDVDIGGADALSGRGDRNGGAIPERLDAVDIGHALQIKGLPLVDLDDDLLGGIKEFDIVADT